ncbi:bacteriocin [Vibrio sp. ABG19]|uniref:bacteriocin n=1 Tax=Vibrio sp. ABG19 TaxID=2817385 RepID=UPI00249EAD15|nr:bacteriocin [Vibrio sp. ABG19]WGY45222.1 bacteriocin [Vibrio sp. ABG19]
MSYSLMSLGADTRKQALAGLRSSAQREVERDNVNQNIKDAKRQKTLSAIGAGAGIGTAIAPGFGTAVGAAAGFVVGELF